MDTQTWDSMTLEQRKVARDLSDLSPQLVGLEGWRVEVVSNYGEKRRFIVGRSTGWQPIHIELKNKNSSGGAGADTTYKSVVKLHKVRERQHE